MVHRKRLFWHIFMPHLLVIICALVALSWLSTRVVRDFWLTQVQTELESRANLVASQLRRSVDWSDEAAVDALCEELGAAASMRITIVRPDGIVLGDSESEPDTMDNHGTRPELQNALTGRVGHETRFSRTLQQKLMYVAVPLEEEGKVICAVRVSMPMTLLNRVLVTIRGQIVLACIALCLMASAVGFAISRRIARPLTALTQGAERFAQGDLEHSLPLPDAYETALLAEAMNKMAVQLDRRIRTVVRQRNEQEAVLTSMLEGVLAVDTEQRVITMNRAAGRLLDTDDTAAPGRIIHEVVRNRDLQLFIEEALSSRESLERELHLIQEGEERVLGVHGTVLRGSGDTVTGAVVVLNDLTRIHRLENVRRDFVANVSHELRTPITSIKGFVETLLEAKTAEDPEAQRFLEIIAKQADRLSAIIDDLLSLSRIEEDRDGGEAIALERGDVSEAMAAAVQACQVQARARGIQIVTEADSGAACMMDQRLLEQAVINLLDNAIKYSQPRGQVVVSVDVEEGEIRVGVADQGCGIAAEHLPRLFERFYRVDKARSRTLGGTGLGLAIVKHIAQMHGGNVTVESEPGRGSTFTIHLPRA